MSNKLPFLIESEIDIRPLLSAVEQFEVGLKTAHSDLEKTGTIKLFEITFELSWKTMKRILKARGKDLNSPKPIIREAALDKLIGAPEVWLRFADERNETVHTYDRMVANKIFQDLKDFNIELQKFVETLKRLKK